MFDEQFRGFEDGYGNSGHRQGVLKKKLCFQVTVQGFCSVVRDLEKEAGGFKRYSCKTPATSNHC